MQFIVRPRFLRQRMHEPTQGFTSAATLITGSRAGSAAVGNPLCDRDRPRLLHDQADMDT